MLVEVRVATTAESSVEVRVESMAGKWVGVGMREGRSAVAMAESTVEMRVGTKAAMMARDELWI